MIIDATKSVRKDAPQIHESAEEKEPIHEDAPAHNESDKNTDPNIYDKLIAESDAATVTPQPEGESAAQC